MAEKCIFESQNKAIVDPESKRTLLRPEELSQSFNSFSGKNCYAPSSYDSQMTVTIKFTTEFSIAASHENKPLQGWIQDFSYEGMHR